MAGVPSPCWGRGASLTPAFLFSPGGSEGDSVRVCSVQPGAHQVTETGPASSWVLHCLTPGTAGALAAGSLGCLVPSVVSPDQRTLVLAAPPASARLGADQPSQPRSNLPPRLGPCGGALPTAVPPSLRLPPGSCSKPWALPGTHCALPRTCPCPVAWLSGGGAILPTCGPTSTSKVGQNNLRALSLPFPALC